MALYRQSARQAGRPGYAAAWREMFVADSRAQAIATIRPYAEWLYQKRVALGHDRLLPAADRIAVAFEPVLVDRFIIGSPAECAAGLARYQAAGVGELILRCQWPGMPRRELLQAI